MNQCLLKGSGGKGKSLVETCCDRDSLFGYIKNDTKTRWNAKVVMSKLHHPRLISTQTNSFKARTHGADPVVKTSSQLPSSRKLFLLYPVESRNPVIYPNRVISYSMPQSRPGNNSPYPNVIQISVKCHCWARSHNLPWN